MTLCDASGCTYVGAAMDTRDLLQVVCDNSHGWEGVQRLRFLLHCCIYPLYGVLTSIHLVLLQLFDGLCDESYKHKLQFHVQTAWQQFISLTCSTAT